MNLSLFAPRFDTKERRGETGETGREKEQQEQPKRDGGLIFFVET